MKNILDVISKHKIFTIFLCTAFAVWLFILFFSPHDRYVDEKVHYRQINRFLEGNYEILPNLTTIPGYHATIALFASVFSHPSARAIRLISFLLSVISLLVFFAISRKLNVADPFTRTLQFVFFPISFFYFPLIYTDIFSLLLILVAFYFVLNKRYSLSAIFSLASLLVRQNNIIWVAFIWVYSYIQEYGFTFSTEKITKYLFRTYSYIIAFISFLLFVLLNRGVAIGDVENHPIGFYTGNIFLFLAIVGFLFLPALIASFHKFKLSESKKFIIFGLGIGMIIAFSFFLIFPEIHKNNFKLNFLRNILLQMAYGRYAGVYLFMIFLGCITLFRMRFEKKHLILFPFIIGYISPSLLVEQRYYIIPIALLLLFRKEGGYRAEFSLVLYFLIISLALVYMLFNMSLFF